MPPGIEIVILARLLVCAVVVNAAAGDQKSRTGLLVEIAVGHDAVIVVVDLAIFDRQSLVIRCGRLAVEGVVVRPKSTSRLHPSAPRLNWKIARGTPLSPE